MATGVFSMEALQAGRGDCLLIQAGEAAAPRWFLIDGGPAGVFNDTLLPRLTEIQANQAAENVHLALCLVSHIDDDHIRGIMDLARAMGNDAPFYVEDYWFNSFDDVIGNIPLQLRGSVAALAAVGHPQVVPDPSTLPDGMANLTAVFASVAQGRNLRRQIMGQGARLNGGGNALLMSGSGGFVFPCSDSQQVEVEVLLPGKARLQDLYKKWETALRAGAPLAELAANADRSVANLSSIVVLVTSLGKTMLLTGDARGDDIIAGLEEAGHFVDGTMQVDLLKLQHHGSDRSVTGQFFDKVRARHIVISGNGEHGNPDRKTLEWIAQSYADDPAMRCYLTYGPHSRLAPDPALLATLAQLQVSHPAFMQQVVMPGAGAPGVRVDLGTTPHL